jgi:hypothetical protein
MLRRNLSFPLHSNLIPKSLLATKTFGSFNFASNLQHQSHHQAVLHSQLRFFSSSSSTSKKESVPENTSSKVTSPNESKPTKFRPIFYMSDQTKRQEGIDVVSPNEIKNTSNLWAAIIASNGFPKKKDGTYVFAAKIENVQEGHMYFGFTSISSVAAGEIQRPGDDGMNGVCLDFRFGRMHGGDGSESGKWFKENYLSEKVTQNAKEVISILTISNSGQNHSFQFIVDGNEGKIIECSKQSFEGQSDEIFPVFNLGEENQNIRTIPFDQVQSTSPIIEELKKQFNAQKSAPKSALPIFEQLREKFDALSANLANAEQERNTEIENLKKQQVADQAEIAKLKQSESEVLKFVDDQIANFIKTSKK